MPILLEQRVLSPAFRASVEAYCLTYADMVEGERVKGQAGFAPYVIEVTVDSNGNEHQRIRAHPIIRTVNDAKKELRQWAVQLGITAASAAKVSVADGAVIAGPLVRLACERHVRDLEDGPARGLRWVPEATEDIFRFFEKVLRLDDVDTPFMLLSWQKFVLGSLFGWQLADGARRFRHGYIECGKGSGKTPLLAGVGLYGLVADGESAAEIYSAAPTQGQAQYLYEDAERMVSLSPVLRPMIGRRVNNLSHQDSFSYFRAVSSEHRALDGKRVHMALLDELMEHRQPLVADKCRPARRGAASR